MKTAKQMAVVRSHLATIPDSQRKRPVVDKTAILTGFRFGALQNIRCADVLGNGVVHVRQDKTGARTCHVAPRAHTFLAALADGGDPAPCC